MAERNSIAGVRTFYVNSEDPKTPDVRYMVVEIKRNSKTRYFCQCDSFFARNLPFLDQNMFQHCKHGEAVRDAVNGSKP